jgi:hypothetical protein
MVLQKITDFENHTSKGKTNTTGLLNDVPLAGQCSFYLRNLATH